MSSLESVFQPLLATETSNVTITDRDENTHYVHKFILSAYSPVFKAMFESGFEESLEGTLKILDSEPETIKQMVE